MFIAVRQLRPGARGGQHILPTDGVVDQNSILSMFDGREWKRADFLQTDGLTSSRAS